MNNTRLYKLIAGLALILIASIALYACSPSLAKANSVQSVGIGDLRRFEAQQFISSNLALQANRTSIGMGDLRYYEAQQTLASK